MFFTLAWRIHHQGLVCGSALHPFVQSIVPAAAVFPSISVNLPAITREFRETLQHQEWFRFFVGLVLLGVFLERWFWSFSKSCISFPTWIKSELSLVFHFDLHDCFHLSQRNLTTVAGAASYFDWQNRCGTQSSTSCCMRTESTWQMSKHCTLQYPGEKDVLLFLQNRNWN